MNRRPLLFAVLGIAALVAGCGARREPGLNVLLVTLDTTRADHFGYAGYEDAQTPRLDAFARDRAVRFDNAISAIPLTLPSHTTIMTGTYPVHHGVHDNDGFVVDDGVTTLAEILGDAGYSTGAVVASFPLDSQFNLDQGFDDYNDDYRQDWTDDEIGARTVFAFGFIERKADQVSEAAQRWLDEHGDERFFLWAHYFDPHQAYEPPSPYDSLFASALYDGEIAFMDEGFGTLLDALDAKGLLDTTIIVVVGDHGESLDQHGEPTHAAYIYDTTVRIPLLIAAPGSQQATGESVKRQVRTIDIAPTILDLLGLPVHADMQGSSLVSELRDPESGPERPALMETHFSHYHYQWAPLRGLRTDRWKYVLAPKRELYDLADDPGEVHNLVRAQPEIAADLDRQLDEQFRQHSWPDLARSVETITDSSVLAKLEALGYATGGGETVRTAPYPSREELAEMPNPRDQSLVLRFINSSREMLRQGQFTKALEVAQKGLAIDSDNPRLFVLAARAELSMGNIEKAIELFNRAAEFDPTDVHPFIYLGYAYSLLDRNEEAKENYLIATRMSPGRVDALENLGAVQALLGEYADAVETLEKSVELEPGKWTLHMRLAAALRQTERFDEARVALQEALRLNPYSPVLLDQIAKLYAAVGNYAFARRALEQAINIAPDEPLLRLHLAGVILDGGGDEDEARVQLEQVVALAPDTRAGKLALIWLEGGDAELLEDETAELDTGASPPQDDGLPD